MEENFEDMVVALRIETEQLEDNKYRLEAKYRSPMDRLRLNSFYLAIVTAIVTIIFGVLAFVDPEGFLFNSIVTRDVISSILPYVVFLIAPVGAGIYLWAIRVRAEKRRREEAKRLVDQIEVTIKRNRKILGSPSKEYGPKRPY